MKKTREARALAICCALALGFSACGRNGTEPREWRPEDHTPPPSDTQGMQGREEAAEASAEHDHGHSPQTEEERAAALTRAAAGLFTMMCAPCHGREGHGDGASRPPGSQMPNLADASWQSTRTNEQMAQVIFQGRGMMPGFGSQIQPEGIAALVMHIRSLAPNAEAAPVGAPPTAEAESGHGIERQ